MCLGTFNKERACSCFCTLGGQSYCYSCDIYRQKYKDCLPTFEEFQQQLESRNKTYSKSDNDK